VGMYLCAIVYRGRSGRSLRQWAVSQGLISFAGRRRNLAPLNPIVRRQTRHHAQLLSSFYRPGRICRCGFAHPTRAIGYATRRKGRPDGCFRVHSFTHHPGCGRVCWVDHLAPRCWMGLSGHRLFLSCCSVDSSSSTFAPPRLELSTLARGEHHGLHWHGNLRVYIRAQSAPVTAPNTGLERSGTTTSASQG
jgi:hypothetical protein